MINMFVAVALQIIEPFTPTPPTPMTWQLAREALDATLADYPNARFRDVGANSKVVCGLISTSNRGGVSSDWKPFAVTVAGSQASAWVGEEDELMVQTFCGAENTIRPQPDAAYAEHLTHR